MIKKLWDGTENRPKLILSGSAALSIEKSLKETLAGRYELIRANHWNFLEAQKTFNMTLKDFIEFGCYPGAQRFRKDLDRWGDYIKDSIVEPAIGRDIMQLHPVENPALFRQVFLLATQLPAQIVSLNKLQAQLQDRGALATIQHYLNLLNAGFLVTGLQKFSESGFRVKASPPKAKTAAPKKATPAKVAPAKAAAKPAAKPAAKASTKNAAPAKGAAKKLTKPKSTKAK